MLTVLVGAIMIGVGCQRRGGDRGARHGRCQPALVRLPRPPARGHRAGGLVLGAAALLPAAGLLARYPERASRARTAMPTPGSHRSTARCRENAVVISWWSYSTPLWYHRWVLGERPDVTIIDERNILDDGLRYDRSAPSTRSWASARSTWCRRSGSLTAIVPPGRRRPSRPTPATPTCCASRRRVDGLLALACRARPERR